MPSLDDKITRLRDLLAGLDRVVVCFSGGVDSGYLLAEAVGILGDRATALTAVSPSLAPEEGADAKQLAEQLGARHVLVDTHELDDARYAANPVNRCYFCKTEVYARAVSEAGRLSTTHVLDGFNVDDRGDHRPGRLAAREQGVRSPLDELGFTKTDIPYGVAITPERLTRVATCERALRGLGFHVCRVRFHDTMARIEVERDEIPRLKTSEVRDTVLRQFRDAGFDTVTVDPRGYRTGSLNEGLAAAGAPPAVPDVFPL